MAQMQNLSTQPAELAVISKLFSGHEWKTEVKETSIVFFFTGLVHNLPVSH